MREMIMIGHHRLEVIARQVRSGHPAERCAGGFVLAAQKLLYGSGATRLSPAEWREVNAYLARNPLISGPGARPQ
jgi:hypothetical protein